MHNTLGIPSRQTRRRRAWPIVLFLCLAVGLAYAVLPVAHDSQTSPARRTSPAAVPISQLPLLFVPNTGQSDPAVRFSATTDDGTLFFTPDALLVTFAAPAQASERRAQPPASLHMRFVGRAGLPLISGEAQQPGRVNLFRGRDRSRWRTNLPTYGRVRYQGIYPGIDALFYGRQGHLEYDLVVAPGANPGQIALTFPEASQLRIDAQGDLLLELAGTTIRQQLPALYQETRRAAPAHRRRLCAAR